VQLAYPLGDVPLDRGVCTDVVIRAFRRMGIDLQKEVHEDMQRAFRAYRSCGVCVRPMRISITAAFQTSCAFSYGAAKRSPSRAKTTIISPVTLSPGACLMAGRISDSSRMKAAPLSTRRLIIHNIGAGAKAEDRLFDFEIIGHYRYF
jgi:uncharacterized protein YijF (DUF1287 family)